MINYIEKGIGLVELLEQHGVMVMNGGIAYTPLSDEETQSLIDNYDPFPLARATALARINEQAQAVMQSVEDEYPEFEKRTWPTQKSEAEAWNLDNNAPTPTLDAIANARGIDKDLLKQKTLDKSNEYNLTAATLAGKRQAVEDAIKASTDLDFINSVEFSYGD